MSANSDKRAEGFLSISDQYKLGGLVTESSHPETSDLSELAANNLNKAVTVLKELDINTIRSVFLEKEGDLQA